MTDRTAHDDLLPVVQNRQIPDKAVIRTTVGALRALAAAHPPATVPEAPDTDLHMQDTKAISGTQTLCGRCGHPMHWKSCAFVASLTPGPCRCRNDEAAAHPPATVPEPADLAEAVSDSLAAATEGTDYAEAPEPSDEPGSPYVLRLTNELRARGVVMVAPPAAVPEPPLPRGWRPDTATIPEPGTPPATVPDEGLLDSPAFRAAVQTVFDAPGEWGPAQGYYAPYIDEFIAALRVALSATKAQEP